MFAGKYGYITLRDLFRWAERYRMAEQTEKDYDWLQHLANDGVCLSLFLMVPLLFLGNIYNFFFLIPVFAPGYLSSNISL